MHTHVHTRAHKHAHMREQVRDYHKKPEAQGRLDQDRTSLLSYSQSAVAQETGGSSSNTQELLEKEILKLTPKLRRAGGMVQEFPRFQKSPAD